jgi:putative glycosyltransferase (TIGR04372 family)
MRREIHYLVKKALRRRVELVNGIWALPLVLVIRLIRPLILISFCGIFSERIGHFSIEAAEQINGYRNRKRNEFRFYFFISNPTCNAQWALMLKRTLPMYLPFLQIVDRWNKIIPGGNAHHIKNTYTKARYLKYYTNQRDVSIKFLQGEDDIAKTWLRAQGWRDGEPFVCLLVRDSAFMTANPDNVLNEAYRDTDITTYLPAVKWLLDQNIWVLRMGSFMKTPMSLKDEHFIDYAFLSTRSDFLDVWLFANSSGVISTGSGPDQFSVIYQIPILYVNAVPLGILHSFMAMIWVPKHLRHIETREWLTLEETLHNTYFSSREYLSAGLEIIDLNEKEILLAVQEFWKRIIGTWIDSEKELLVQDRFWQEFQTWPDYSKNHDWKHPKARVGQAWLASMGDNFLKSN